MCQRSFEKKGQLIICDFKLPVVFVEAIILLLTNKKLLKSSDFLKYQITASLQPGASSNSKCDVFK